MFKYLPTWVLKKNFKHLSAFTVLLNQPFHLLFAICVYQNSPLFTSLVVLVGRSNPLLALSSPAIPCWVPQECKALTTADPSYFFRVEFATLRDEVKTTQDKEQAWFHLPWKWQIPQVQGSFPIMQLTERSRLPSRSTWATLLCNSGAPVSAYCFCCE